jgi:exonuclease V gamma subunit
MREWILSQAVSLASRGAVLGWEIVSWQQAVHRLAGRSLLPDQTSFAVALWRSLCTRPPVALASRIDSCSKKVDVALAFAPLFMNYCYCGIPLEVGNHWQAQWFRQVLEDNGWAELSEVLAYAGVDANRGVYLFGIDWMPSAVFEYLRKVERKAEFCFSPTAMFWEDLRSEKERVWTARKLSRAAQAVHEEMDRLDHPLLSNWGMVGRKRLKLLFEDPSENYEVFEGAHSTLKILQSDLLTMERTEVCADSSLRIVRTGPSLLRELEVVREELLRAKARGIQENQMRVYAPDISVYASLIPFVMRQTIAYRIDGIDLSRQSSYFQAFLRLLDTVEGRWSAADWKELLEMPPFARASGWQAEEVEKVGQWIDWAGIRWGIDSGHRSEIVQGELASSGEHTWEAGLDRLGLSLVYFDEGREWTLQWSEVELFQAFLVRFYRLREVLLSWRTEKTLESWIREILSFLKEFLWLDEGSEKDRAAAQAIRQALEGLRGMCAKDPETLFPFSLIRGVVCAPAFGEVNGSQLQGVRFQSLEPGTIVPTDFVVGIGMSEEAFPRSDVNISHDLLRGTPLRPPSVGEKDRYLFMQLLLSARNQVVFTYPDTSPEDGKEVQPSLLLQELRGYYNPPLPLETAALSPIDRVCFASPEAAAGHLEIEYRARVALDREPGSLLTSPVPIIPLTTSPTAVNLAVLRSWILHPLRHYLHRELGLFFRRRFPSPWDDWEEDRWFRFLFLREALRSTPEEALQEVRGAHGLPPGPLGEALGREWVHRAEEMRERIQGRGLSAEGARAIRLDQKGAARLEVEGGGAVVAITGETSLVTGSTALHLGDDNIGGFLRSWPELLAALAFSGGTDILCLRTGRVRSVTDPRSALQALLRLYRETGASPSILSPGWADVLLRKKGIPDSASADEMWSWMAQRSGRFRLEEEVKQWSPLLEIALAPLTALFPQRKTNTNCEK